METNMMELDIRNATEGIFQRVLSPLKINIEPTTPRIHLTYWDSVTHLNLILAVEDYFKIKIFLGEIEMIDDLNDLVSLIAEKLK